MTGPGQHLVPPRAERGRITVDAAELAAWGEQLGRNARAPLIIALSGDLGAGKTTLTQAICRGYGVTDPVTSPTYALVQEYASPSSPVFHIDLYRLTSPAELTNIAWDDILSANALVIVEWPERAAGALPRDHVPIDLEFLPGDESRRVLLAG
jgi:tRNA threonylcarbamoyladenosine biosynthesis protein TsaE